MDIHGLSTASCPVFSPNIRSLTSPYAIMSMLFHQQIFMHGPQVDVIGYLGGGAQGEVFKLPGVLYSVGNSGLLE